MGCQSCVNIITFPFIALSLMALSSCPALASGFGLREASPTGVGRAFAGEGVIADTAATTWYNPAGMTQLPGFTATGGAQFLFISSGQQDKGSTRTVPGLPAPIPTGGGDGGNPFHRIVPIPSFYGVLQINERLWAGIGVNAPFGLDVDYNDGWFGRYDSKLSDLVTYNVQPSLAWKVNDRLSIGGGVSVQYIRAELTNALPNLSPLSGDGLARVKGDDVSLGWNLGAQLNAGPARLGLHYRSRVKHRLSGTFEIEGLVGPLAAQNRSINARAPITLPDSLAFSAMVAPAPGYRLLGTVEWTNWSLFDAIRVDTPEGTALTVSPQNYKDSWSFHFGGEADLSEQWTLRGGFAADATPTVDAYRSSRVPDGNRVWLTAGASYHLNDRVLLGLSYAHVFVTAEQLDREDGFYEGSPAAIDTVLRSENRGNVDMVGADITIHF